MRPMFMKMFVAVVGICCVAELKAQESRHGCEDIEEPIHGWGRGHAQSDDKQMAEDAAYVMGHEAACENVNANADAFLSTAQCEPNVLYACAAEELWWDWCDEYTLPHGTSESCWKIGTEVYDYLNETHFNGQASLAWICAADVYLQEVAHVNCEISVAGSLWLYD